MSVFKKQKMTRSIFELLNVDSKDDVDEGAVIEAAQQNPNDIDRMFEFRHHRCCPLPLHKAIELGLGTDAIKSLISPVAIRNKISYGITPLHHICGYKSASLETLGVVLNAWPEAVRDKDAGGYTPLHSICGNRRASLEVLSAVLNAYPEAAREKCNAGRTPLHEICVLKYCGNRGASLEMLSVVLKAYPEAAREKDNNGMTPLHLICWNRSGKDNNGCANKSESLRIIQTIAYEWLKAKENRTSHSAISLISKMEDEWGTDIRDDIKELFHHLSSLFEENNQSNPSPPDIMTHFINTSWWNGVWLVVNRHPSIAKTMKLQTTLMTDFLFTAGKRLSLASMMEVIKNEPDLLEGV